MKTNVFNERGGTVKIFCRLILKEKVHKKENLHLKFVLFHIFKNNHAMYIQVNAKIVAGLEFQDPLVKVEDVVMTRLFLTRNGAFISYTLKV